MTNVAPPAPTTRTIAGMPVRLYPITGFTIFDVLAFYGMQTLVIYYVYFAVADGGLELEPSRAIALVSAFVATTFLGTIFTSWLIDRIMGPGIAMRVGAGIAIAGYLVLTLVPGELGLGIGLVMLTFSSALTFVAEGTLVSGVMTATPPKREAGFTIFYMGSALGAFVGITVSGFTQSTWGFQIGFLVSAIAMAVALAIYLPFRRGIESHAERPDPASRPRGLALLLPIAGAVAGMAALVIAVVAGFNPSLLIAVGTAVYVLLTFGRYFISPSFSTEERSGVLRYLPFFVATVTFNLLFQQLYTTVAIHSEANTDRLIFGFELPPSTVLGIAPLCTIIAAPFLAALWARLGSRQPSLAIKFTIAFAACGAAMGALAVSSLQALTPIAIVALIVLAFGAADVIVSPSGMSLATASAPKANESRMLSLHYVGISLGISLAGIAGEWFVPENASAYFAVFSGIGLAVAVGMFVVQAASGRRASV